MQEPSLSQLIHIAKTLEISLDELVNNKTFVNYSNKNDSIDFVQNLYNNDNYYDITKYYDLNKAEFDKIENIDKLFYLGNSYYKIKLYKEAEKFLKRYKSYYIKNEHNLQNNNIVNFCTALNSLFVIYKNWDSKKIALANLKLAELYLTKFHIEQSRIGQSILCNITVLYLFEKQYQKVIDYSSTIESLSPEICYPQIAVNAYKSMAIAYYNLGNYEKSIKITKKVIALYSFIGDDYNKSIAYFNYVNALIYDLKLEQALDIIEDCKNKYNGNKDLFNRFSLQEMSLYFNMNKFHKALDLSTKLNRKYLKKTSLCDINFILGHINYLSQNKEVAITALKSCEKHFIEEMYSYDLHVIYTDLYSMTNEAIYKERLNNINFKRMQKNIIIDLSNIPGQFSQQSGPPVKRVACFSPIRAYYWPCYSHAERFANRMPSQAAPKGALFFAFLFWLTRKRVDIFF
ncbi:hypothetical protein CSC2_45630 [Clostridium zeae]|uniref:HTH cro/C1-type domain-containing protein n=1 Tax=Clostridium zeae TaxID=2759022 RepID=A0ABQ1EGT4_9CLOT|nr:hypothetical protein CSC2_45630 [Clostridium zeae]